MNPARLTIVVFMALGLWASHAFAAPDPFLKAAGHEMRNAHGKGDVVTLRGVNLGGWLVFEPWQTPMDAGGLKDDWSAREVLAQRFGAETRDRLLAAYQNAWITERDFDLIAAAGFNVIRLPFWYLNLQDEEGKWRGDAFARIDWAVAQAWKRGIYTILDLHGAPGGQSNGVSTGRSRKKKEDGIEADFWTNEAQLRRTTELWRRVAAHYKGNPAVAAYDLLNEPFGAPGRDALWAVYDRLYKAVREIDPDHTISVEGCWGGWVDGRYQGWGWDSLPPPDKFGWTNMLYQQHSYQWAWNDLEKQKRNIDSDVADWKRHHTWNVPCFIGEFNCMAREEAWSYAAAQFAANGMNWAMWTYKATHGSGSDSWGFYNPRKPFPPKPDLRKDSAEAIREKWSQWTTENFAINPMLQRTLSTPPH